MRESILEFLVLILFMFLLGCQSCTTCRPCERSYHKMKDDFLTIVNNKKFQESQQMDTFDLSINQYSMSNFQKLKTQYTKDGKIVYAFQHLETVKKAQTTIGGSLYNGTVLTTDCGKRLVGTSRGPFWLLV